MTESHQKPNFSFELYKCVYSESTVSDLGLDGMFQSFRVVPAGSQEYSKVFANAHFICECANLFRLFPYKYQEKFERRDANLRG